MQKAIKVNIAGKEYSLRGEDEEIIKSAAEEVNTQLDNLKGKTKETASTLPLLAALNIAEKYYINRKQHEIDINFLAHELNEMINYLSKPSELAGEISSE
jgi:cell division protein ZapA (FtsZ GTPase activity inhibitor)